MRSVIRAGVFGEPAARLGESSSLVSGTMRLLGIDGRELAVFSGCNATYISHMCAGRKPMTQDVWDAIIALYEKHQESLWRNIEEYRMRMDSIIEERKEHLEMRTNTKDTIRETRKRESEEFSRALKLLKITSLQVGAATNASFRTVSSWRSGALRPTNAAWQFVIAEFDRNISAIKAEVADVEKIIEFHKNRG